MLLLAGCGSERLLMCSCSVFELTERRQSGGTRDLASEERAQCSCGGGRKATAVKPEDDKPPEPPPTPDP